MKNDDLVKRIQRRLDKLNKSARQVSMEATGKPDIVRSILRGNTEWPRVDTLRGIAIALETTEEWLAQGIGAEEPADVTTDVREANLEIPARRDMPLSMPLMGTAAGSHVKGAAQLLGVVDYVRRPPALYNRTKAYALMVEGDSMWPEHPHNSLRMVDPEAKVAIGDSVIVQTSRGAMDDVEASIGHLLKRNATHILLGKLNPRAELAIERRIVIAIHRVLTMNDLFGV